MKDKYLLKRNCVVLLWHDLDNPKDVRVVGVFKNEKEANGYKNWLGDKKHLDRYSIVHSSRFVYTTPYTVRSDEK